MRQHSHTRRTAERTRMATEGAAPRRARCGAGNAHTGARLPLTHQAPLTLFFSLSLSHVRDEAVRSHGSSSRFGRKKKHGGGCQQTRSCERVGTAWSCVRGARVGGRAARSRGCDRGGRGGRGEAAKLGDEYKANEAATRFTLLPHVYSATYCTKRAVLGAPGKATLRIVGEAGSSRERTCALSPSSHRRWGLQGRHTLFGPTARRPRAPIRTRARSRRGPSTPRG